MQLPPQHGRSPELGHPSPAAWVTTGGRPRSDPGSAPALVAPPCCPPGHCAAPPVSLYPSPEPREAAEQSQRVCVLAQQRNPQTRGISARTGHGADLAPAASSQPRGGDLPRCACPGQESTPGRGDTACSACEVTARPGAGADWHRVGSTGRRGRGRAPGSRRRAGREGPPAEGRTRATAPGRWWPKLTKPGAPGWLRQVSVCLPGSWDQALRRAPCSLGSLLLPSACGLSHSLRLPNI